jgi:hypothetical protein
MGERRCFKSEVVHAGKFALATDHGNNDAGGTDEHEGEQAEHEENGESLGLTDEAALVSHAGGAGEEMVEGTESMVRR